MMGRPVKFEPLLVPQVGGIHWSDYFCLLLLCFPDWKIFIIRGDTRPASRAEAPQIKVGWEHYLTRRHQSHRANDTPSLTEAVLLSAADFTVFFIKQRERYQPALHHPGLITAHFTGNKVCWIHSFMAIDQNGNKWLWLNPADSRNIAFHDIPG